MPKIPLHHTPFPPPQPKRTNFRSVAFFPLFLLCLSILPTWLAAEPGPLNDSNSFQVQWQNSQLSVKADQSDLVVLLEEISRQSGIRFEYNQDLKKRVSADFTEVPAEEGIKRLIGDAGMTYSKNLETGKFHLETVTLLPSSQKEKISVKASRETNQQLQHIRDMARSKDEKTRVELTHILRNNTNPTSLRVEAAHSLLTASYPGSKQTIIDTLRTSTDTNLSYSLVSMLGKLNDESAAEDLSQLAVTNTNPTLRYKAIQSLIKNGHITDKKITVLKQAAMEDPNHYNRARAIIALAETRGKKEMDFLLSLQAKEKDPFVNHVCTVQIAELGKQ